jgi:hypothetical protein
MAVYDGKQVNFYFGNLVSGGTQQVETATVVGSIGSSGAGFAAVAITAAGMTNSPKTISVAVSNSDSGSDVAGKIRTALGNDANVTAFFTVSGTGTAIILTAIVDAANDSTMNISIDNGSCTGLTTAASSSNTTAGVAASGKPPLIGIKGLTPNVQYDSEDGTTSLTTGDGKTSTLVRAKVSASIDTDLLTGAGAEISGNTLAVSIAGGSNIQITKVDFETNFNEQKVTSQATPAGFHAFTTVRADRKGSCELWMDAADTVTLGDAALAVVIALDSNNTITGTAKFSKKSPKVTVDNVIGNAYDFDFQGAPTIVGCGLATGIAKPCLIEFLTSGKSWSGTAIVFVSKITSEVDKTVKVNYSIVFTGTVTGI